MRKRLAPPLFLALLGGLTLACLAGCGSKPAGATLNDAASTNMTDAPEPAAAENTPPRPKLPPGAKTVAQERAGNKSYDKTFDDIRFDIKPGDPFRRDMLPPAITALSGQRIRIRGFILPTAQQRGIKQFVLVRDNQECCFGPGAALYDCILIEMQPGKTTEFSIRPVAVEGTFDINEIMGPDGMHLAIYRIQAETVRH
jgi:hypothetical protein